MCKDKKKGLFVNKLNDLWLEKLKLLKSNNLEELDTFNIEKQRKWRAKMEVLQTRINYYWFVLWMIS